MNEPTEKPVDDHHGREREENLQREDAPARPRWHARLKQLLKARLVAILDAGIASLVRLKSRAGGQDQTREERVGSRRDAEPGKRDAEPKKIVVAALPRSRLRHVLIYVMLTLMAAFIGMTFAYSLLSRVISDQSEKIRVARESIAAFNLENQEKATHIAELMKELDRQRGKLSEAEKRLRETTVKAPEPVSKAVEAIAERPATKQAAPKSASPRTGLQPSKASSFSPAVPAKTGNCELAVGGNSAEDLKRCLDNYNRK